VSFPIIRGSNGRHHGVDAEVEVDVAVGSETSGGGSVAEAIR
jgi:hypothetical protein